MDRFFSVKHKISFNSENNDSDYYNKEPFICSVLNEGKVVPTNIEKLIKSSDDLDVEYAVVNEKETEEFTLNFEEGKVDEYVLNGVDIIKESAKGKYELKQQQFRLFKVSFNN